MAVLVPFLLLPQTDAAAVVARMQIGDRERVVTRGDLALEMAFHMRRKDEGRAACEVLVVTELVRREARRRKLWPRPEEVRALWAELQRQLKAAGRDPAQEAVVRFSSEAALLEDLAVTLAHEKIVRAELELQPAERVSPEMLKLWTAEMRQRSKVVDDPDQLPIGTAARIGDQALSFLDLGMLLVRTSSQVEQDHYVRQIAVLAALDDLARRHGIEVTRDELRSELARRRQQAESDPRFAGMSFDALLQSQGITPEWLLESRVFRGQVLQQKLAAVLHPDEQLRQELQRDRDAVLDRVGPRRRLGVVYLRALDEPNELVPRDFAAAMEHLATVRRRLDREPFDLVARIESDDPGSKVRGGDLGWLHRQGSRLPEPVAEAAFELAAGAVSAPIRAEDGCYLIKVLEIEPMPDDAELCRRLREQNAEQLTQQLLRQARIVRADGTPLDGDDAAGRR